jgi:hypothetical protein
MCKAPTRMGYRIDLSQAGRSPVDAAEKWEFETDEKATQKGRRENPRIAH